MRFACGALATLSVSDTTVAPWNWDLAAGEAAHYAQLDVNSHYISGTEGSLTLPRLALGTGLEMVSSPQTRIRVRPERGQVQKDRIIRLAGD